QVSSNICVLETHPLDEEDEALHHCISDILVKLMNMGTVADSNEAMCREYIFAILHASVCIAKEVTEDLLCMAEGKQNLPTIGFAQKPCPAGEFVSDKFKNQKKRKASDAFGESDYEYLYGIVSTGTDWYFILYTTEDIYCTSETEYHISLTKSALKNDVDLKKSVKR
ncbi:10218_t:CDS:2, partial [Paraglomus brasilianum]